MNRLSAALFFCCLCFLGGCASTAKHGSEFESASAARSLLLKTYPELRDPRIDHYLSALSRRLEYALSMAPGAKRKVSSPSISVVQAEPPIACSLGAGIFVLSTGMISALSSEAELAFVIAHELSHEALGHHLNPNEYGQLDKVSLANESDADTLALDVLVRAGYDPRAAVSAIIRAFRLAGLSEDYLEKTLPGRLQNIASLSLQSGWSPPGTLNRRDFAELQTLIRR